jgi:hypothetical protein
MPLFAEGELEAALCADIQMGWNTQEWLTIQRQARIAKANQVLDHAHIEGVGEKVMSVDPFIYHSYGQKYGYHIWKDADFREKMMRDNPELRVKSRSTKIQVGYR